MTPAIDHWIISLATHQDWRTPPCDRGKDRLRVLGRYVACAAERRIDPVPETYDRMSPRIDPNSLALCRKLFPDYRPDQPDAEKMWVHLRMNQIREASVALGKLDPMQKVRIPKPGSIHEMREVMLQCEILLEAWIIQKKVILDERVVTHSHC
jgi:hypothetical protein